MATPTPTVQVAPGANWDDTAPTFVDVTAATDGWSADRKYGWESRAYQGGRATIIVSDSTRTYDPLHTAYPADDLIGAPVAITAGEIVFYGFVDTVSRSYGPHGRGVTTLNCVDLWAMLARITVNGSYASATTGNRAGAILNAYLPAAYYNVTSPSPAVTMPAITYGNVALTNVLAGIVAAEAGMVWVDKFGQLQFAGRHYPASTRMTVDQATLSDVAADTNVVRYNPVSLEWASGDIINSVAVSRGGVALTPVEDAASIARYGHNAASMGNLEVVDDIQAISNANRLIAQFKDPLFRLPPVSYDVVAATGDAYDHASERDLWDRVRWKMTPYGGGSGVDHDAFIVGVSHAWTANPGGRPYWSVRWDLADAAMFDRLDPSNWWRWGGTYSQWGGTYAGSKWAP